MEEKEQHLKEPELKPKDVTADDCGGGDPTTNDRPDGPSGPPAPGE